MPALLRVLCLAIAWIVQVPAVAQEVAGEAPATEQAPVGTAPEGGEPATAPPPGEAGTAEEPDGAGEPDIDLGPVSAAGQRMLDRLRGSVVQVRGFYGTNRSEAFHGSAFAVARGGLLVTNYHVIARAALNPGDYRLEYHADDGQVGPLTILAIDVARDLAVIRAEALDKPALPLRTSIPPKGDRAYAVGYPLQLGLVITEGIANGRLDNEYGSKLHYAGPMNPGMSGGPAVDSKGRVFGVNVSISTRGQLISFLVPAEFVAPLLQQASKPLAPGDTRKEVSRQLRAHQSAVLAALPGDVSHPDIGGLRVAGRADAIRRLHRLGERAAEQGTAVAERELPGQRGRVRPARTADGGLPVQPPGNGLQGSSSRCSSPRSCARWPARSGRRRDPPSMSRRSPAGVTPST